MIIKDLSLGNWIHMTKSMDREITGIIPIYQKRYIKK